MDRIVWRQQLRTGKRVSSLVVVIVRTKWWGRYVEVAEVAVGALARVREGEDTCVSNCQNCMAMKSRSMDHDTAVMSDVGM